MENKLLIELFIDEEDKENGLDIISFVSAPAIEKDFMHFKKDNNFNMRGVYCHQEITKIDLVAA